MLKRIVLVLLTMVPMISFSYGVERNSDPHSRKSGNISVSTGFKTITDAIKALKKYPAYAHESLGDFREEVPTGYALLLTTSGANVDFYLPPGSADTLVTYTENNAGKPLLTVLRFDGKKWTDVSSTVLPGYINKNGTNYLLDSDYKTPVVRDARTKQAMKYEGGKFVPEH